MQFKYTCLSLALLSHNLNATLDHTYVKEMGLPPQPPPRPRMWLPNIENCCSCTSASPNNSSSCLTYCGFAIIPGTISESLLDEARRVFERWNTQQDEVVQHARLPDAEANIQSNGKRIEYGLPDLSPFNSSALLFNPNIVGSVIEYLSAIGEPSSEPTMEAVTIIDNMPGSTDQNWHRDSPYVDGVKVQIPLVDVLPELGPIELEPRKDQEKCRIIRGEIAKGSAVLYLSTLKHRGTANRAQVARPVIDYHYMLPESAKAYDYFSGFPERVLAQMDEQNARFAQLCAAAGMKCRKFSTPIQSIERPAQQSRSKMDVGQSFVVGAVVFLVLCLLSFLGLL